MVVELEVGDELTCKLQVKEINHFDHVPIVKALNDTPEETNLITWENINGGDLVKAEVLKIEGDEYVTVKLNSFISGRVYKEHLSDIPLKKIPKSFSTNIGKRLKMKVLSIDKLNKTIELTLKELILKGKKKMPLNFDDV